MTQQVRVSSDERGFFLEISRDGKGWIPCGPEGQQYYIPLYFLSKGAASAAQVDLQIKFHDEEQKAKEEQAELRASDGPVMYCEIATKLDIIGLALEGTEYVHMLDKHQLPLRVPSWR